MATYYSRHTGADIDSGIDKAETAYQKPDGGIPASDLSELVRSKLELIEAIKHRIEGYYPRFYVGTVDVSNGHVNTGTVNRAYTDFIQTNSAKLYISANWLVYIVYYDSELRCAGNSGGWKTGVCDIDNSYPFFRLSVRKDSIADFSGIENKSAVEVVSAEGAVMPEIKSLKAVLKPYFPKTFAAAVSVSDGTLNMTAVNRAVTELLPSEYNFAETADGYSYYIVCYDSDLSFKSASGWKTGKNAIPECAYYRIMAKNDSVSDFTDVPNDFVSVTVESDIIINKEFTIGRDDNVAEVISEAMKYKNSVVYIEPYEHDCVAEWEAYYGPDYFTNMSSGRGLELKNNIHIIGRSGHKLKCYYTGSNDYVMENFSLFNNSPAGSGYILENVCIDTKKIRYCVHDERSSDVTPYTVKYLRCIMSQDMTGSTWDHSRACIGGGLGQHADVVVEDCIFNTVTSPANMDSLAYHNSAGSSAQNSLVIKNCYCAGDSTLQLAAYGSSAAKTKVLVANCSFGSPIEIHHWDGADNLDIYRINNEIRG